MTEQGSINSFILKFIRNGVEKVVAVQKKPDTEKEFEIVAKDEDKEDTSQIWIYYSCPDILLIRNLKYPQLVLADDNPGNLTSTLGLQVLTNQAGDVSTQFYLDSTLRNSSLRKTVILSETNQSFVLVQQIPEACLLNTIPIDISDYALNVPPYFVPVAILFSEAAQEYAITLDTTSHLNEQGRPIKKEPFKFGADPRQYWYYMPSFKNAFFSCAESNQVLDDMSNDENGYSTLYTHLHHGQPNQQWKFDNRYIIGQSHQNYIAYIEDRKTFKMQPKSSPSILEFYYCPCFNAIPNLLKVSEVHSPDDMERPNMHGDTHEEDTEDNQEYFMELGNDDGEETDDDDDDDDETADLGYSDSSY